MNTATANRTIELKNNGSGATPGYFARRDLWDWLFAVLGLAHDPQRQWIAIHVAGDQRQAGAGPGGGIDAGIDHHLSQNTPLLLCLERRHGLLL